MKDRTKGPKVRTAMIQIHAGTGLAEACRGVGLTPRVFLRHVQKYFPGDEQGIREALDGRWRDARKARRNAPQSRLLVNAAARERYWAQKANAEGKSVRCVICNGVLPPLSRAVICSAECAKIRMRNYRLYPEAREHTNALERARYAAAHPGCKARVRRAAALFDGDGAGV